MKKLLFFLGVVLTLSFVPSTSNAQVSRGITKALKKVVPKSVPKVKPRTTPKSTYTPRVRPRTTTTYVTCGACSGRGSVSYWNPTYQCYQSYTCTRCSGTGKVRSN